MNPFIMLFVLAVLTFVPALELRASIPVAFFTPSFREAWSLPLMVTLCFVANIFVGIITFWLMRPVELLLRRWGWFERNIWPRIAKGQEKLHPYVAKYGELGLAVFIGVPLPGTGAYTGAFGAYLLGFDRRRFWIANALGVAIAAVAVVALCLLIDQGIVADDSLLRKLFLKSVAPPGLE